MRWRIKILLSDKRASHPMGPMRLWVGLACLAAFLPVGLSFALTTAEQPDELAAVRASYRRPEAIPFPGSNPYSEAKAALERYYFSTRCSRDRKRAPVRHATTHRFHGGTAWHTPSAKIRKACRFVRQA